MAIDLVGAYTAIITPFKGGSIDENALRELVDRQIESGIDGLVACGTTGESPTLSKSEKQAVIEIVAEQTAGRVPVIAGTGTNNTKDSIEITREASKVAGVEAALVVTPYYNKPNQEGLQAHFRTIADEGGLPVIMYNVPGRCSVSLTVESIVALSKHDGILAIKEASGNLVFGSNILEQADRSFSVLSGDDFTTFGLCALGGKGCISVVSNILPGEMSKLCLLLQEDNLDRAREIHYKIQPLARLLFSDTNPIPVKTAAALLGWCEPEFRLPLTPLSSDKVKLLRKELLKLDFHNLVESL